MAYATRKPNDNPLLYRAKTTRRSRWASPPFCRGRGAGRAAASPRTLGGDAPPGPAPRLRAVSAPGDLGTGPPGSPQRRREPQDGAGGGWEEGMSAKSPCVSRPRDAPRTRTPTRFRGSGWGALQTPGHRRCHRSADPRAERGCGPSASASHSHVPPLDSLPGSWHLCWAPSPKPAPCQAGPRPTLIRLRTPLRGWRGGFHCKIRPGGKVLGSTAFPKEGKCWPDENPTLGPALVPVTAGCRQTVSCQT